MPLPATPSEPAAGAPNQKVMTPTDTSGRDARRTIAALLRRLEAVDGDGAWTLLAATPTDPKDVEKLRRRRLQQLHAAQAPARRSACLSSAVQTDDPDAVGALMNRLADPEPTVAVAAGLALTQTAANNRALRRRLLDLLNASKTNALQTAIAVCHALGRAIQTDPEARAALRRLLHDSRTAVREAATVALGGVVETDPDVRADLRRGLTDDCWAVRTAACQALGRAVHDTATTAALAARLDDAEPLVAQAACAALAQAADRRRPRTCLIRRLTARPSIPNACDTAVRAAVCRALAQAARRHADARRALAAAARDPDERVRAAACRALAQAARRHADARRRLAAAVRDPDERVRAAACRALAEARPSAAQTWVEVIARLEDDHEMVRAAAARALIEFITAPPSTTAGRAVCAELVRRLSRRRAPVSEELCVAAAAAGLVFAAVRNAVVKRLQHGRPQELRKLCAAVSPEDPTIRRELIRRMTDRDPDVRAAAVKNLAAAAPPHAAAAYLCVAAAGHAPGALRQGATTPVWLSQSFVRRALGLHHTAAVSVRSSLLHGQPPPRPARPRGTFRPHDGRNDACGLHPTEAQTATSGQAYTPVCPTSPARPARPGPVSPARPSRLA